MNSDNITTLSVQNIKKCFPIKEGVFQTVVGHVHAVDNVSFDIIKKSEIKVDSWSPSKFPVEEKTIFIPDTN